MTSIGAHLPRRVSVAAVPRSRLSDGQLLTLTRTRSAVPPASWMRVGKVSARSAARYFAVWAGVLYLAQVVVLLLVYALLSLMGVTRSVSRALAVLSDQSLSASGVVPVLQPSHVVPLVLVAALVLSLLFLVAAVGVVLVHNATTTLTGGLTVRLREAPRAR